MAHYDAIVAGAGPAGLAVVGNIIEAQPRAKILWIDPDFQGGRLNKEWREVPSNTKVKLFIDYAKAVRPFRDVIDKSPAPNSISTLEALEQNEGCPIAKAGDMVVELSRGLCETRQVDTHLGEVREAEWDDLTSTWTIAATSRNSSSTAAPPTTRNLILCIGSHPTTLPLPLPPTTPGPTPISLTLALQPSNLSQSIPQSATFGVIGASHSAVLVLLNLYNLSRTTHPELKVYWFTRNKLQYAEERDGWILRDNTGLKGLAATFARENLEDAVLPTGQEAWVQKVDCSGGPRRETEQYEKFLTKCSHVVTATGFQKNPLPKVRWRNHVFGDGEGSIVYDNLNGGFLDPQGREIAGLYGAGIAFPEKVTDPEGNVSMNVGLWKFMKYLRRVVPQWVEKDGVEVAPAEYKEPQFEARL